MKRLYIISCVILVALFLDARQIPLSDLNKVEIDEMCKKFWKSFETDVIGPFQMDNIGFDEVCSIMLREANVVLDGHSGLRASGSFGAMHTIYVPRTFSIPVTSISNAFSMATKILNCSLDCDRGHIHIEQKEISCPSFHLPTNLPITVLRSSRHDYPSKRRVMSERPLAVSDAKTIMEVFCHTKNIALTVVCCEYFLRFPDGEIIGVVTDDTRCEAFGFDFGWSTNSVFDADDGSSHRLKLICSECEDDEKPNEKLRKELYQIVIRAVSRGQR